MIIAYDGTHFAGWQAQRGVRTVQATLEAAIEQLIGTRPTVRASGRTDAGVHALGQVVGVQLHTRLSNQELLRALNAVLPPDVAVLDVADAPEEFHATRHAIRKRYRYVIHNGPVRDVFRRHYCWHYTHGYLDAEAMHRAAQALVGTHDFRSFQTAGAPRRSTVRTVFEIVVQRGRGDQQDLVTVEIEANGFLYNMVRAIVGTLVEVGRGARSESWPEKVLKAADRRAAGRTAPPQGLFLLRVDYPCASHTSSPA